MSPIMTVFQLLYSLAISLLGPFWPLLTLIERSIDHLLAPFMPVLKIVIEPATPWMQDALTLCFPVDDTLARTRINGHTTTIVQRFERFLGQIFAPIINAIDGSFGLYRRLSNGVHGLSLQLIDSTAHYRQKPKDVYHEQIGRLRGRSSTLYGDGVRFLQDVLGITYVLAVCARMQKEREDDRSNDRLMALEARVEHNEGSTSHLRAELKVATERIATLENAKTTKCPCQQVDLNFGHRAAVSPKKVRRSSLSKLKRRSTWVATNILPPKPKVELPQRVVTAPNTPNLSAPTDLEVRPESLRRRAISNLSRLRDRFGLPLRK